MRRFSKIISIIMAAVVAISVAVPALGDVKSEKSKLSDLNEQKQEAQSQKEELESSKSEAEEYIKNVDSQLTNLATQIYETNKKLDSTQKNIEKTKVKLKKAQDSIVVQYGDMKLRIKYMYENGDTQMLDLILNSKSITDFLNKAEYITELSQYDRKMLQKLKKTKKEIADAKSALEKDKNALIVMQEQQQNDKTKLEKLSDAKKQELESYKDLIASSEATAKSLDAEISAQEQRIAAAEQESIAAAKKAAEERAKQQAQSALNDAAQRSNNNNSSSNHVATVSGYTWPCPGYTSISSDFGYRSDPFSGDTSFHSGIDIPAPSGTPVVAAASGTVEWSEPNATAGNWIGISHGNGVYTIYMHMSALLVSAGTKVSAGQTIGLVGTTGSSTGNHLHFTVRQNGAYVSPWNYVGR